MRADRHERSAPPLPPPLAASDVVALWFTLAQRSWTSLTVVPADPGGSSEELVRSVVDTGKRLGEGAVTAITMSSLDARAARTLATLQRYAQREGTTTLGSSQAIATVAAKPGVEIEGIALEREAEGDVDPSVEAQLILPAPGRVVIAIPSVLGEPLGLAVTQASSLVAISIALGRTCLADARRTIELIGRDRIAGCILV
jgi:hypothetical protein